MMVLMAYADSLLGVPYKWGGNNPLEGLDCSGMIVELMKSAGEKLPMPDMNAQQLFDHYSTGNGEWNRQSEGALAFFGKSAAQITHVAIFRDRYRIQEAGGGGHGVMTREDAEKKGAFVRIRPVIYREDLVAVIRPYYRGIGQI